MMTDPRLSGSGRGGDDNSFSDGPILPRWVFWLALPGIAAPVLIFAFILLTQKAHDEASCPYRERARHPLAPSVLVLDEARSCLPGVEEHRYSLLRGERRRLLGERRFEEQAFAPGHYQLNVSLTAAGEAEVIVHNDGHGDVLFREGTAHEHEKGVSLGHRPAPH